MKLSLIGKKEMKELKYLHYWKKCLRTKTKR